MINSQWEKIAGKTVRTSVFLTIWQRILSAELTILFKHSPVGKIAKKQSEGVHFC